MSLLGLGEFHAFGAAGQRFLYLVPSAAVFALDEPASALIDALDAHSLSRDDLLAAVAPRFPDAALDETLAELEQVRAVGPVAAPPAPMPTIQNGLCTTKTILQTWAVIQTILVSVMN